MDERKTVVEWCPHCGCENEIRWNTEVMGFKAYCPYCGNVLMLCDECQHQDIDGTGSPSCEWCENTNSCRYNPVKQNEEHNEKISPAYIEERRTDR